MNLEWSELSKGSEVDKCIFVRIWNCIKLNGRGWGAPYWLMGGPIREGQYILTVILKLKDASKISKTTEKN